MRLAKEGSKAARVLERRRSERVDSVIEDLEVDQEVARRLKALTGLYVPMILRDRPIGVITAHDREGDDARFSDEDVRLAETFAARAAAAVDLSERVASDALRRVVSAQELERQRLARELHDETGQALTSILLGLKSVEDAAGEEDLAAATAGCESSWSRRSRTCGASRSSCGRRRSTTSGSSRRSSGSSRRSTSRRGSRSTSSRGSATSGCRPRSRPRSTGSHRKPSRTSSSTRRRSG